MNNRNDDHQSQGVKITRHSKSSHSTPGSSLVQVVAKTKCWEVGVPRDVIWRNTTLFD